MDEPVSRRLFVGAGVAILGGSVLSDHPLSGDAQERSVRSFPRQDLERVREVVRVAHFDPDAVRTMVSERPALATAGWDWGFGDWETPLGAASHTGGREIAECLMSHGARPGLLTFAMLGDLDAVRAMIEARPAARRIAGPHGLTLLHHARAGGNEASAVVEFLEELGGADPVPTDISLTCQEIRAYTGSYTLDVDPPVSFEIIERDGHVAFRREGAAARNLMNQGDHEFHPVGAPAVRLRFEVGRGGAETVKIVDGGSTLTAKRVG